MNTTKMLFTKSGTLASIAGIFALMATAAPSQAATIALNANDAGGQSSFNTGLNWDGGLAPSAGNDYTVSNFVLRTPSAGGNIAFAGDSLSISGSTGRLLFKGANNDVITVANLILNNGGWVENGAGSGDGINMNLAGDITLSGTGGMLRANGGNVGGRTMDVSANIGGSGRLTVSNNEPAGAGTITLMGANTYTGGTVVGDNDATRVVTLIAQSALGDGGNVSILLGGKLQLDINTAIGADQNLLLTAGLAPESINLNFVGTDTIAGLSFNGGSTFEGMGTYGAIGSGAMFENTLFTGTGTLTVVPEPFTSVLLLFAGAFGLVAAKRRRKKAASY